MRGGGVKTPEPLRKKNSFSYKKRTKTYKPRGSRGMGYPDLSGPTTKKKYVSLPGKRKSSKKRQKLSFLRFASHVPFLVYCFPEATVVLPSYLNYRQDPREKGIVANILTLYGGKL